MSDFDIYELIELPNGDTIWSAHSRPEPIDDDIDMYRVIAVRIGDDTRSCNITIDVSDDDHSDRVNPVIESLFGVSLDPVDRASLHDLYSRELSFVWPEDAKKDYRQWINDVAIEWSYQFQAEAWIEHEIERMEAGK